MLLIDLQCTLVYKLGPTVILLHLHYIIIIYNWYCCRTFNVLARILLRATKCIYGDKTGYTCACLERAALKGDYDTQERNPILTASVQNYSTTWLYDRLANSNLLCATVDLLDVEIEFLKLINAKRKSTAIVITRSEEFPKPQICLDCI